MSVLSFMQTIDALRVCEICHHIIRFFKVQIQFSFMTHDANRLTLLHVNILVLNGEFSGHKPSVYVINKVGVRNKRSSKATS